MQPYRNESDRALTIRLPTIRTPRRATSSLALSLVLFTAAAALAVGIVICLDRNLVVLAFTCFFSAVFSAILGVILLGRGSVQLRRWATVTLAIEVGHHPLVAGETVDVRVYVIGRKRIPSLSIHLCSADGARVPLASIADLGRLDLPSEDRVVTLTIPRDVGLGEGLVLEAIADDLRGDPFVQRFRVEVVSA